MIASCSYVNIVPFTLNIHLLLLSNMTSYSCAALILTLVLSSQSTMISVPFSWFITAWYSQLPNWLSHAAANDFLACLALFISADVMTGRICPTMVSGPMFKALITLGYSELMSIDPIQSCMPFIGVATYAPAAGWFSSHSFLYFLPGTCMPLLCASFTMSCSVTATAPIVVCRSTVFWCAISLASSMNFNFFSSLANSAVSCLLYSMNKPKSFL